MDKMKRMKELVQLLNTANERYYKTGKTIMEDSQYDLLIDELESLEDEIGVVYTNSPTVNVGASVIDELEKIVHEYLMLSLAKCHSVEEIVGFSQRKLLLQMYKLDGMTIAATYENGILIKLETRGNGIEGNNILHHAASISNLPKIIYKKGKYVIHGEAIILYFDFVKTNEKIRELIANEASWILDESEREEFIKTQEKERLYKNPRNLVAGTLNSLDATASKERKVQFIAWDVIEGSASNSVNDRLNEADELGFTAVKRELVDCSNEEYLKNLLIAFKENAEKEEIPIDGVVFKFDDIEFGKTLGRTSKFFRNGIAYKYEDEKYPAKLIDVEWTMGKTGVLTPTLITEPIEIEGSTVSRASVHNLSIFNMLRLTKGCTCMLYKANMIIPQCDAVYDNEDGEVLLAPRVCPVCESETIIQKENETEQLACSNPKCRGKLLGKFKHFVSKSAMDIRGVSEKTLEFLIDKKWIEDFSDIFILDAMRDEWILCQGFKEKSVDKLLESIEKSKNTELWRFLSALSIPLVGESTAKDISKYFDNSAGKFFENWLDTDWGKIEGIGGQTANEIKKFFFNNREDVLYLSGHLIFKEPKERNEEVGQDSLSGMTFVITGELTRYSSKNELKEILESMGAKVSGSVSKKTTALISNTVSTSSKYKKAQELGIVILSEDKLLEKIGLL